MLRRLVELLAAMGGAGAGGSTGGGATAAALSTMLPLLDEAVGANDDVNVNDLPGLLVGPDADTIRISRSGETLTLADSRGANGVVRFSTASAFFSLRLRTRALLLGSIEDVTVACGDLAARELVDLELAAGLLDARAVGALTAFSIPQSSTKLQKSPSPRRRLLRLDSIMLKLV